MIKHYFDNHEDVKAFDKDISFYDSKIDLFKKFLTNYIKMRKAL